VKENDDENADEDDGVDHHKAPVVLHRSSDLE
jgi:hypothetical protein